VSPDTSDQRPAELAQVVRGQPGVDKTIAHGGIDLFVEIVLIQDLQGDLSGATTTEHAIGVGVEKRKRRSNAAGGLSHISFYSI